MKSNGAVPGGVPPAALLLPQQLTVHGVWLPPVDRRVVVDANGKHGAGMPLGPGDPDEELPLRGDQPRPVEAGDGAKNRAAGVDHQGVAAAAAAPRAGGLGDFDCVLAEA